jgi:hypothetical protein
VSTHNNSSDRNHNTLDEQFTLFLMKNKLITHDI